MSLPKLRFPEFRDAGAWEEKRLGEIAALITEKTGNRKYTLMSINSGVGLVSQIEKFGREIAGSSYKNYFVICENDFAYNKSATKDYPEGFIAMHSSGKLAAVPNSIFTCFKIQDNKICPQYLNYLFLCNLHGKWLKQFISVGARAHGSLNIDNKYLLLLPIPLPKGESSLSEQQKIADCLSSIADRITLETQKLDTLKAHKKGLMQQLFPAEGETLPKLRFPEFHDSGEWEIKKLGEVCDCIVPGRDKPKSFTGDIPWVTIPDIQGLRINSSINKLGLSTNEIKECGAKIVPKDSVIMSCVGTFGLVSICDQDLVINQQLHAWIPTPKINNYYLAYCLILQKQQMERMATNTTIAYLNKSTCNAITIPLASLSEQQKIADCLTSIDEAIAAQSQAIDLLKLHKKGLMQQLFPSVEEVKR